jgi:prolyl 4-hydroxylase
MASEAEPLPYYEPTIPFAEQRSELRAQFSASVGQKLDSAKGLWRFAPQPGRPVQLYIGDNFLGPDECRLLCRQIDAGCFPSPLYEKEKHEGVRTSQTCNLNPFDPLVSEVEGRIADLLGIDRAHGETLQGQRYEVDQQFKEHADFFYIDQPYWAQYEPQGGQRTWTAMIFLNEVAKGGATRFKLIGLRAEPRLGRILIWNNMAMDGSPNPWTLHEGEPVEEGTKYIVTKWYRERHFK